MKVTVTLGSGRPGGLDVSLRGLCDQTYDDFEVVFVDARYHLRHERVMRDVKEYGFKKPFIHVPNHRYQKPPWSTICAGYNTGFMLAAGELVVMLCDYAYAPPGWIEQHVAAQKAGRPMVVMAPHDYRDLPPLVSRMPPRVPVEGMTPDQIAALQNQYSELYIFAERFSPENMPPSVGGDLKMNMATGFISPDFFHTKNESFPLAHALAANGMDEYYDRGRGPGDFEFAWRLVRSGLDPWLCREAVVQCLNPRVILPNPNVAHPDGPDQNARCPGYPERQSYKEGCAYYETSKTGGRLRARNPYSLLERREQIAWWREAGQELDVRIPRIELDNAAYYGDGTERSARSIFP